MANVKVSLAHQLTRAEARKKVEQLIADLQEQYGSYLDHHEETWLGDTLDFKLSGMGVSVTGQVIVEEQVIRIELVLPFVMAMLAGKIKKTLEEEGRKLLLK
jgi:putative polyhydroxyalkanoate system protein